MLEHKRSVRQRRKKQISENSCFLGHGLSEGCVSQNWKKVTKVLASRSSQVQKLLEPVCKIGTQDKPGMAAHTRNFKKEENEGQTAQQSHAKLLNY